MRMTTCFSQKQRYLKISFCLFVYVVHTVAWYQVPMCCHSGTGSRTMRDNLWQCPVETVMASPCSCCDTLDSAAHCLVCNHYAVIVVNTLFQQSHPDHMPISLSIVLCVTHSLIRNSSLLSRTLSYNYLVRLQLTILFCVVSRLQPSPVY